MVGVRVWVVFTRAVSITATVTKSLPKYYPSPIPESENGNCPEQRYKKHYPAG